MKGDIGLGRIQDRCINLVNEPGLYRLISRSDKPEAVRFQDWVFEEVLPSIRKTGSYSVRQPQLPPARPGRAVGPQDLLRQPAGSRDCGLPAGEGMPLIVGAG
jgi:hypothetical protein